MAADEATCSPGALDDRAVDSYLSCVDQGPGVGTDSATRAYQLAIKALSHGSARLPILRLLVGSVDCLMNTSWALASRS